ncbi:hypothetical protein GVAV_002930 [Gurleya vavrai]
MLKLTRKERIMTSNTKPQAVLEQDLSADETDFLSTSIPSAIRIIFSGVICGISIILSFLVYPLYAKEYDISINAEKLQYLQYSLLFYFLISFTIYVIVDLLLTTVALVSRIFDDETSFFTLSIIYNKFLLSIAFTFFILSFTIHAICSSRKKEIVEEDTVVNKVEPPEKAAENVTKAKQEEEIKEKEKETAKLFEKTPLEIKEKTVIKGLLAISIFIFVLILKGIIYNYINFNIHYKYYKERIDENNKRIDYLLLLNNKVGARMGTDLKLWAGRVFDKLLRENAKELTVDDFNYFFGEEDGDNMFSLFDENFDNSVNKEEFKKCYFGLYKEKLILKKSLSANDNSLNKLDLVLTIIFIPLAGFLACIACGQSSAFSSVLGSFLGVFLPATFIFGAVLSEMFQSIIFIFQVRPFDVGDFISVLDKIYEVQEMGLLYSTLLSDSRSHNFPNEILRKNPVVNLRKSKWITEKFDLKLVYESCKDKIDDLKKEVSSFLKKNKKEFKQDMAFSGFEFCGVNGLKFEITIKLSCPYQDIKGAKERKDKFRMFLHEAIDKLDIKYL